MQSIDQRASQAEMGSVVSVKQLVMTSLRRRSWSPYACGPCMRIQAATGCRWEPVVGVADQEMMEKGWTRAGERRLQLTAAPTARFACGPCL